MDAAWLGVAFYTETQVLTGFIYQPYEERLLDILNGISVRRRESRGRFLELTKVTIDYLNGKKETLPTAYINKASIQLAATLDGDLARGIGGRVGAKPYPFVQKSPVVVRLRIPAYALTGSMYRVGGQSVWHVLEEKVTFLPLTNVKIRPVANGIWWTAAFAAVNREQILSLQEEETPLAQSS